MTVKAIQDEAKLTERKCTHCGLPVPMGLVEPDSDSQFCCHGCRGAYQLIQSSGLGSFYAMAGSQLDGQNDALSLKDRDVDPSRFGEFDSPQFLEKFAQPKPDGQYQIKMSLEGIHCAACIWLLEKLPSIVPGVVQARVNWSRGTIRLVWQVAEVPLSQIALKLFQLGYTPHPIRESEKVKRFQLENRKHLSRLGVAGALAGNNMIISAALYFGMFAHMTSGMTTMMRIASCLIGLAALLIPGRVFLMSAWQALRTKTAHMDLPIALALFVGTVVGTVNVIRGAGEIYFDSLSVLVFLLLIGRWLQFRQQSQAADSVEMLYRMTPQTARKVIDGEAVECFVELLAVDDVLEIRAGELVPADGVILEGRGEIDESILTGESRPVAKGPGQDVFAGTMNLVSTMRLRASATGESTRLSAIARLVEESSESRPQMVQWANQIGGYFVVAVLVLASITFTTWLSVNLEVAVDRTMALLIVACPCALALATPLAIAVCLGRAAKAGIMVKSGDVIQALQKPGMIWLDKTGTLTEGELRVESWEGDRTCLVAVAAMEQHSQHPVAKALVDFAEQQLDRAELKNDISGVTQIEEQFGFGVSAVFDQRGILVGNRQLMEREQVAVPDFFERVAEEVLGRGQSPVWISVGGEVIAVAAIGDAIRSDAKVAVEQLQQRGWQVGILSGDHQGVVDRVAKRLGIEPAFALGETLPEEKLDVINRDASETVVMVGDGVNDSAALAAATVGLAVKGGAEASLAAAPVYLAGEGLTPILDLMQMCDSASRTMKRNLGVSLAYNLSFATLAFLGFINPFVAAILMPFSSLTVVSLSLHSGSVGARQRKTDQHSRVIG